MIIFKFLFKVQLNPPSTLQNIFSEGLHNGPWTNNKPKQHTHMNNQKQPKHKTKTKDSQKSQKSNL